MPIRVDAYTAQGLARGVVVASGHLRDVLEAGGDLKVERATWQPLGGVSAGVSEPLILPIDDILIAVGDDDPTIPVHASWHALTITIPPFAITGELPTLPGYDPGRALARPTGSFVVLRDLALGMAGTDAPLRPLAHIALVNRYTVERVSADLMLGFYFPGAVLEEPAEVSA